MALVQPPFYGSGRSISTEAVSKGFGVHPDGNKKADDGGAILGVTEYDYSLGSPLMFRPLSYPSNVLLSEDCTAGQELTPSSTGFRLALNGDIVGAIALESGSNGDYISAFLVSYIKQPAPSTPEFDSVQYDTAYTPGSTPEGLTWWNSDDYTLNVSTGLGPILQVGQETYIVVYNATASQIDNGKVVHPTGGLTGSVVNVEEAIANTHVGFNKALWVTTMDIPADSTGIAIKFGKVRNLDTSSFDVGDTVYLSDTSAGDLTTTPPIFPSYTIQIGGIAVKDSSNGELVVSPQNEEPDDTSINYFNGSLRESFDFRVSSDGVSITGTLSPSNGHADLTMLFSDGFSMLTTTPPVEITLTAGTDTNPQTNYIYIPKSTKTLTVSTSSFPYEVEHIKIAQVLVQSIATVQENGALRNQNWNDHMESTSTFQGHMTHIGEKLRQFQAQWFSGTSGSVTINSTPTPDDLFVKVTSGIVYQLHRQNFPILDMNPHTIDAVNTTSQTFTISGDGDLTANFPDGRLINVNSSTGNDGLYTIDSTSYSDPDFVITVLETIPDGTADGYIADDIHIVNDSVTPYKKVLNLNGETSDSTGTSLSNRSFSFVLWGVANKSGDPSHIMLNLPSGSYARLSPDLAVIDANNFSTYSIPDEFKGVGFLIARFTFQLDSGGQIWTLYDTEDLRGKTPNTTAGGGAGGGGVTDFTGLNDTPSTYTSEAGNFTKVNTSENALEYSSLNEDSSGNLTVGGVLKVAQFTATEASALTPANGDFIYVTSTDATFTSVGFWGYENSAWVKL